MTANEMRAKFLLGYEGARLANRTFNDREITDFLTKAELELVKQRYDRFKNRSQRGYGSDNVRASELSGLTTSIKKYSKRYAINGSVYNNNAGSNNPFMAGTSENGSLRRPDLDRNLNSDGEPTSDHYGIFVPVPNEAMYILLETVDTYKDTCQKFNIPVQEITYDKYMQGIYDPYAQPYDNLTWSLDWGSFTPASITDGGVETPSEKEYTTIGGTYNMVGVSTSYWNGSAMVTKDPTYINTNRSRLLLPGKGWDVVGYYIHYIIKPNGIVVDVQTPNNQVDSILPAFIHQEIVDLAVKLASASIIPEPNKYQTNQIESKEDE